MYKKILSVGALLGVVLFTSCEKQVALSEINENNFAKFIEEVEENFDENEYFIDSFIEKFDDNNIDEESMLKMLDLLNVTKSVNFDRLNELNVLDGVYTEINYIESNPDVYRPSARCNKKLRVRNIMLAECEKYPFGVSDYCGAAVMLAWWWRSGGC